MQRVVCAESPLKHKHANGAANANVTSGGRVIIPGQCKLLHVSDIVVQSAAVLVFTVTLCCANVHLMRPLPLDLCCEHASA